MPDMAENKLDIQSVLKVWEVEAAGPAKLRSSAAPQLGERGLRTRFEGAGLRYAPSQSFLELWASTDSLAASI